MTSPKCLQNTADFFASLTHEIVEALTDPSPVDISIIPPHIDVLTGENEIADVCEPPASSPTAGPPAFTNQSGQSPNQGGVNLATYFSNAKQVCLNFSDNTAPSISNVTVLNSGQDLFLNILGSGFGTFTGGIGLVTVDDNTDSWQAGNAIDQNAIQFATFVWTPTQILAFGLTNLGSFHVTQANASLTIWVCDQNSLNCGVTPASTPPNSAPAHFAIKTSSGNFITAINEGGIGAATDTGNQFALHTDATSIGALEKFHIVAGQDGGVSLLTSGIPFILGSTLPFLVTAVDGGGIGFNSDPGNQWPIHTDAKTVGSWEKFTIVANADGTLSFGTPDGVHFITAENGGNIGGADQANKLPIHTNTLIPGLWENLTLIPQ